MDANAARAILKFKTLALAIFAIAVLIQASDAQDPVPLVGHSAAINTVVYTGDGAIVATGSSDQFVKLWDAKTYKEIRTLQGHTGQILCLAVRPDNSAIVSGAADNTLRMWDIPQPDPLHLFEGHTAAIRHAVVSPNGRSALSVGADKSVYVWDLDNRKIAAMWEGHTAEVLRAAYRSDNNLVATGDATGTVIYWNVVTGKPQTLVGAHVGPISGLEFHPNNQQLISTGHDGLLKIWQLPIVAPRTIGEYDAAVRCVAVTSDSQTAVVSSGTAVQVFGVANGQLVRALEGLPESTGCVAVSPNNTTVAAAGENGIVKLWNLADGADRGMMAGHQGAVNDVVFHPDNAQVATAGEDGTVRLWRVPTPETALAGSTQDVTSVDVSSNGQMVATASADNSVRLFNPENGQAVRQLAGHEHSATITRFRADAAQIATGDKGGEIRLWNPADGTVQAALGAHAESITAIAYHPDGGAIATAGAEGSLKFWQLPAPPAKTFAGHTQPVTAVALSQDAKVLISGSSDKTVRMFDPATGQQVRQLEGQTDAVTALAMNSAATIASSGGADGVVRFWMTTDGSPWQGTPKSDASPAPDETTASLVPAALYGHDGAVRALTFHDEPKRIATAGADGTIRLWRLPTAPTVLPGETGPTSKFIIGPDGKLAAVAGQLRQRPAVFVRNLQSGKTIQTLLGHSAAVTSLAFSADGGKLVTGSSDNSARVWDLGDSKFPELVNIQHPSAITAVSFNADATQVFAATADNAIHQWTLADETEVRSLTGHSGAISRLLVHENVLFSASADNTVRLWNAQTGAAIRTITHGAAVADISVSADGKQLASGGADKLVKVWNIADGKAVASLAGHAGAVVGLSFSRDGAFLTSTSADTVWLWDVASQRRLQSFPTDQWVVHGIAFAAAADTVEPESEGNLTVLKIAAAGNDGTIRIYSPDIHTVLSGHKGEVTGVAMLPSGTRVVSCGNDKTVRLWNLMDGKGLQTFGGATDAVTSLSVSADGKQLAASCMDNNVYLWDLSSPPPTKQPVMPTATFAGDAAIRDVAFSADGSKLATCGENNLVHVWDIPTGFELQRFTGHTAPVGSVAIAAGGTTLVSGAADNQVRLWSVSSTIVAAGDNGPYQDLAFTPDGTQLIAVDGQPQPTVWPIEKLQAGKPAKLPVPAAAPPGWKAEPQRRLAIRPDGKQLATLGASGVTSLWDLESGSLAGALVPPATEPPEPPPSTQPANADANAAEGDNTVPLGQLSYNSDGNRFVVGQGNRLRVYDLPSGLLLEEFHEPSEVTSVVFSTDNQRLVVGRRGTERNAAVESLRLQSWLLGHEGPVTSVVFTPDGNELVTGGTDKSVRRWSSADGSVECLYAGNQDALTSLAVTNDGQKIVAGGVDRILRVWPINPPAPTANQAASPAAADEEPLQVQPALTIEHPAAIRSVSISADNLKLVSGSDDSIVRVWDLTSGRQLQRFEAHSDVVNSVVFAADNKTVLSAAGDKTARVFNLGVVRTVAGHEGSINDVALFANGAQAATAGADGKIQVWNLANGEIIRTFENESAFRTLAVRSDNAQLVAADAESKLWLWDLANGTEVTQFKTPAIVSALEYSSDNEKIVAAMLDGALRFYSPQDGSQLYELNSDQPLTTVTFTKDGRQLLSGDEAGSLRLWSYASPTATRTFNGHGGSVYGVAFSPDGARIASASADATVRLWDANAGNQLAQLSGHQGPVYNVDFSADGALLVSCGADKSIRLWDVLGGRQLKQIPVGDASLYSVAFHSDGKRVVAAGLDKKIRIYDVLTGKLQQTIDNHKDYVYRVAFNRRGDRLMSCGYGGNIVVWNPANGQKLFEKSLDRVANFADYSPDSDRIVVAGGDGIAYFVDVPANAR